MNKGNFKSFYNGHMIHWGLIYGKRETEWEEKDYRMHLK